MESVRAREVDGHFGKVERRHEEEDRQETNSHQSERGFGIWTKDPGVVHRVWDQRRQNGVAFGGTLGSAKGRSLS